MLKKIDELFIKIQKNFGGFIMLVVLICCTLQVIFRTANVAAPWTEEFSRVGLAYMTFLMSALGVRLNAHPSVDVLVRRFPRRVRFTIDIVIQILIGLVGFIFMFYGWKYFRITMKDRATTYHYVKAWWYWPIPVSGVITIIYAVRNIIYLVISIIRNEDCTGFRLKEDEAVTKIEDIHEEEDADL